MLASLTIRNFVLIEDGVLDFEPGLNVLTGETGAGKTLLTRALGLLMGERAEEGLVGQASAEALIQAVFYLGEPEVAELPEEVCSLLGGVQPGEFIVTRRLGKEGRNRSYLNDTAVTLGAMGSAVGALLSFAGQHEYRRLLDPNYQLSVLDQWAGPRALALVAEFREAHGRAREASRVLAQRRGSNDSRMRELELLKFQAGELGEARLSVDEEQSLLAEQRVLARAGDILRSAGAAADLLSSDGDRPDAGSLLAQAGAYLSSLAGVDETLDRVGTSLAEAQYLVADLARELHSYIGEVSVDPGRLSVVDERLRLYTDLVRKYGGSTESAVRHLEETVARLQVLEDSQEDLARLDEAHAVHAARAHELASALSEERREAAPRLEAAIAQQLGDLGMPSARLSVDLRSLAKGEGLRETGADSVEFLLLANPGQQPRSLAKTASGGELSRVLLAVKCALAGAGGGETLVFDEIDAGIGGRTAVAVGNKLRELAASSQLIVITHLPQVAALAAAHFLIDKEAGSGSTVARLSRLGEEALVGELCRMLGGREDDAEAMAHARELRDKAAGGLLD